MHLREIFVYHRVTKGYLVNLVFEKLKLWGTLFMWSFSFETAHFRYIPTVPNTGKRKAEKIGTMTGIEPTSLAYGADVLTTAPRSHKRFSPSNALYSHQNNAQHHYAPHHHLFN